MTIPAEMTAAVVRGDEAAFELLTVPTPRPRAGEALIRVTACGVCHTDLHVLKREVVFPRPAVLGHEVSGEIVEIGPGGDASGRFGVGDRVVAGFIMPCAECDACRADRDDLCENFFAKNRLAGQLYDGESRLRMPDGSFLAMYSMGGLAEYAVVPIAGLARVPEGVPLESAALLGCAGMTAYAACYRAAPEPGGRTAAIIGVGGIGASLIPMLRMGGAERVIAIDVQPEKLEFARALGATDTVDAASVDAVAEVRRLSPSGIDIVFEALGRPATFRQGTQMLADGGTLVVIGIAAAGENAEVEITPLVRRGHRIVGSFGGRTRVDLPAVVDLAANGRFDPERLITRRYGLDQVAEAYATLDRGGIIGRALIVMGGDAS